MANFDISVMRTLKEEGGYVNDPKDKGGETKYGIAKRYHPNTDIKNLTVDGAKAIYKAEYWNPIKGDSIKDQSLADSVFDFGVIAGTGRALQFAQKAAAAAGLSSWRDATGKAAADLNRIYGQLRIAFHESKVAQDPSQAKFLKGWKKRANRFFTSNPLAVVSVLGVIAGGAYWMYKHK